MWCSQCVSNRLLVLSLLLCLERCGRYHEEGQTPPSHKGVNSRSRRTRLSADLPGARAEKVPSTSALPLSHSVECDGGGCVRPRTRDSASLNASAVGESTPAGDFEAVLLNASGRVDPSGWSWYLLTTSSQRVSPCNRQSKVPRVTLKLPLPFTI